MKNTQNNCNYLGQLAHYAARLCGGVALWSSLTLAGAENPPLQISGIETLLAGNRTGRVEIAFETTDELREKAQCITASLTRAEDEMSVEGEAVSGNRLIFEVAEPGFYTLKMQMHDAAGALLAETQSTYALLPEIQEMPEEWGTCVHFAQGKGRYPQTLDLLTLCGFSRVRDDLGWEAVEYAPGKYQMPEYADRLVAESVLRKIRVLFVFGYPNTKCYPNGFQGKPFPTDNVTRMACAKALAFAANHFGDAVREWELWNEPNYADPVKDYLPLARMVYPELKAASPNSVLITGGGSGAGGGPGGGFIIPVAMAGGVDAQDGWSIHPYMAPEEPDFGYGCNGGPIPRVSIPVVGAFHRDLIRDNQRSDGKSLEVWVTELGWNSTKNSDREQAAYAARMFLLLRRENFARGTFWYDFQNDGENATEPEDNFGLIRKDFSPKMSYQAVAVTAALLGNRPFLRNLEDGENKAVLYGDAERQLLAVWTTRKEGAALSVDWAEAVGKTIQHCDWQGRPLESVTLENGQLPLQLDILPQYYWIGND